MLSRKTNAASLAVILLLTTAFQCSSADLSANVADVTDAARAVVSALKANLPSGDERFDRAEKWLRAAEGFQKSFAAATDPEAQARLLPTLSALVASFQSDLLPLLNVSPNVSLAIAGADAALRIVVRRFQREAAKVKPDAVAATRSAVADADASLRVLDGYLRSAELKAKR